MVHFPFLERPCKYTFNVNTYQTHQLVTIIVSMEERVKWVISIAVVLSMIVFFSSRKSLKTPVKTGLLITSTVEGVGPNTFESKAPVYLVDAGSPDNIPVYRKAWFPLHFRRVATGVSENVWSKARGVVTWIAVTKDCNVTLATSWSIDKDGKRELIPIKAVSGDHLVVPYGWMFSTDTGASIWAEHFHSFTSYFSG